MVSIEQDACFTLIIKITSEIHPAYDMPTPSKLLLKSFFNILGSILQIYYFAFYHLDVNIFSYHHCILFVINFHVAKFYVSRYLHVWCNPIFRDSSSWCFLIVFDVFVCIFRLFSGCGHACLNAILKLSCIYYNFEKI